MKKKYLLLALMIMYCVTIVAQNNYDFSYSYDGGSELYYKITNDVNDKVYIGQTKRNLDERWKEHKKYALEEDSQTKFYNAIRIKLKNKMHKICNKNKF